jgi:hypothetical protein
MRALVTRRLDGPDALELIDTDAAGPTTSYPARPT